MPLSNLFSNKLDDLVDSFDDKDVISRRRKENVTRPRLSVIGRNEVASHFEIEKGATGKNRVAGDTGIEHEIEGVNGDLSDVSFSIKK